MAILHPLYIFIALPHKYALQIPLHQASRHLLMAQVLLTCFASEICSFATVNRPCLEFHITVARHFAVGNDEFVSANASKEIHEEMGIGGVELRHQFDYLHISPGLQYWGSLFSCTWDGPLRFQPQEVESGMFMSLQVRRPCIQ